jgi:hypothetical protein
MSHDTPVTRRDVLKAGLGLAALPLLDACGGGDDDSGPGRAAIVRYAVHPSIGIARVGNSPNEYFLGQEVPGPLLEPVGGFRDTSEALKRQGARFRVYGYDAAGAVVREITAAEAQITWTVHLANKKAQWYDFETALDVPVAEPAPRRNRLYAGNARKQLAIDPGPRSVSGTNVVGPEFDNGTFLGSPIYLGELHTDDAGRLIVLGGRGTSFSPRNDILNTFANNDGWCDDTSDGPVRATIRIGDATIEADPGWVVVTPPNYGPSIAAGYISIYDVVYDLMRREGKLPDRPVSFADDIYPLFARVVEMQWVNAGVLRDNGPGKPGDYLRPEFLAQLNDPSPASAPLRALMFRAFRDPAYVEIQDVAIPPMYGDEVTIPATTPQQFLAVTPTQYQMLARWRDGNFIPGLPLPGPRSLAEVPVALQPLTLDRAALEVCLGGAFHPGCEATWPVRIGSMYELPFRLKVAPPGAVEPNYGEQLTPSEALSASGPLVTNYAGSLTRWMAVPWQADTASCRSGYQPQIDPYLPTFWPARVPNHVLTEADYQIVMDVSRSREVRVAAFYRRLNWLRYIINDSSGQSLQRMVESWYQLGLVAERPGPLDLPELPELMKVETSVTFTTPPVMKREPTWGLRRA